jgi:zinc/manganese transport system substrate-binding protein
MLGGRPTARHVAALCVACVSLAGCGAVSSTGDSGRLRVVATTTQLGDLTRAVGGDAVDVHQLLRANTDPHEYEPRPSDVVAAAGARVVFLSGDGLDARDPCAAGGGHASRPRRAAGGRAGCRTS